MLERFTTQARGVVVEAQHEARQLKHDYVGTEHVLLALLQPDSGASYAILTGVGLDTVTTRASVERLLAESAGSDPSSTALSDDDAAALQAIGIDLAAIRAKLEESFGPGALDPPAPAAPQGLFRRRQRDPQRLARHLPWTARAKKVLELSLREAVAMQHKRISAEHILLGLLRERNGLAYKVIASFGIDPAELRRRTIAALAPGGLSGNAKSA